MIFWSGFGFLVPIVFMASFGGLQLVFESVTGDKQFWINHSWPKAVASFATATILFPSAAYLEDRKILSFFKFDTMFDGLREGDHTLFFLSIEFWGHFALILGIFSSVSGL